MKRQLHKHPSILPVDFDISPTTGELLLNVPADPIPLQNSDSYEPSSDPDQNFNYDGQMSKSRAAIKSDEMEPQSNEVSMENYVIEYFVQLISDILKLYFFKCITALKYLFNVF